MPVEFPALEPAQYRHVAAEAPKSCLVRHGACPEPDETREQSRARIQEHSDCARGGPRRGSTLIPDRRWNAQAGRGINPLAATKGLGPIEECQISDSGSANPSRCSSSIRCHHGGLWLRNRRLLPSPGAAATFRLRRLAYVKVVNTHLGTSNTSAQTATGPVTIQDTGINPTTNMLRLPSLSESQSQYMFASNINFTAPNNRSAFPLRTDSSGLLSTVSSMFPLA